MGKNVKELREQAKECGVKGRWNMNKAELEKAIWNAGKIGTFVEMFGESIRRFLAKNPGTKVAQVCVNSSSVPTRTGSVCSECCSFDIVIVSDDAWCAQCGSGKLIQKTAFLSKVQIARERVNLALFTMNIRQREGNFAAAILACHAIVNHKVKQSRRTQV